MNSSKSNAEKCETIDLALFKEALNDEDIRKKFEFPVIEIGDFLENEDVEDLKKALVHLKISQIQEFCENALKERRTLHKPVHARFHECFYDLALFIDLIYGKLINNNVENLEDFKISCGIFKKEKIVKKSEDEIRAEVKKVLERFVEQEKSSTFILDIQKVRADEDGRCALKKLEKLASLASLRNIKHKVSKVIDCPFVFVMDSAEKKEKKEIFGLNAIREFVESGTEIPINILNKIKEIIKDARCEEVLERASIEKILYLYLQINGISRDILTLNNALYEKVKTQRNKRNRESVALENGRKSRERINKYLTFVKSVLQEKLRTQEQYTITDFGGCSSAFYKFLSVNYKCENFRKKLENFLEANHRHDLLKILKEKKLITEDEKKYQNNIKKYLEFIEKILREELKDQAQYTIADFRGDSSAFYRFLVDNSNYEGKNFGEKLKDFLEKNDNKGDLLKILKKKTFKKKPKKP